jgi:2,3-diketo-5-methylthio-1-phosphopentane phosphatase
MTVNIICDFDGTITLNDVTDDLLERFADCSWKRIEEEWLAGKIGSRECMARQVSLIRASKESLNHYLDSIEIDPGFSSFVDQCKEYDDNPVHVVSDGIEYVIQRILRNNKVSELPVMANTLVALSEDRYCLEFFHRAVDCRVGAGTCKCAIARTGGNNGQGENATLLIGDGLSDFCLATRANFVFAKNKLLDYCREHSIPHLPFATFSDVERQFGAVFTELSRSSKTYCAEM